MRLIVSLDLLTKFIMVYFAGLSLPALAFTEAEIKECDTVHMDACFASQGRTADGVFEASRSFRMVHRQGDQIIKTRRAALLVHGLTDSPYYLKDIAKILYDQGMNVLAIRLSGHGTRPTDLFNVTFENWIDDVNLGLHLARQLGQQVVVGGFSTGGALVLNAAYEMPDLAGVLLFSPAVELGTLSGKISCLGNGHIMQWTKALMNEDNTVKYRNMPVIAACQVNRIIKTVNDRGAWRRFAQIKAPIFMAYSQYDTTISTSQLNSVALMIRAPGSRVVNYTKGKHCRACKILKEKYGESIYQSDVAIGHGDVPLRTNTIAFPPNRFQFNHHFNVLEYELNQYLRELN